MSYGLIYTIPFASLEEVPYVVKIEKEGYEGESTELVAGGSPFTVDIEDAEFLYTPTRFSTATLEVVGSDYLRTLFSTDYRQFRVTLEKNGAAEWCGYIKPELYTQDYSSDLFTLELECMSAMSVLEYLDYTIKGEERAFVSLWYLLKRCIEESGGKYASVYIPHVYASSSSQYAAGENVIDKMLISEQNFFDEDDKPMKLKEVLEEICKFLNWTCVDWNGSLFFIDVDHDGEYYKYDAALAEYEEVSINSLLVQDIGFAGSDHSLDILPGFNKATVKCSNYPVGEIFPKEDFKTLARLGDKIANAKEFVKDNKVSRKIYLLPNVYKMYHYEPGTVQNAVSEDAIKSMSLDDVEKLYGAIPIKRCNYEMEEIDGKWYPNITNYNYEDLIQIRTVLYPSNDDTGDRSYNLKSSNPILTFKNPLPTALYRDGAFAIQGSVQLVMATRDNLPITDPIEEMYSFGDDLPSFDGAPYFICEFSIGNKYWNGTTFADEYSTFNVYIDDGKDGSFKKPVSGGFLSIKSTKTLNMPYDGLDGYIMPLASSIDGQPKFVIKSFIGRLSPFIGAFRSGYVNCFLKDLKCVFQKIDGMEDTEDSDRIYENVLNESYINEMDEVEMKVSSYNNDGACYSKVLISGDYLTTNLYNVLMGKNMRPEELLITRAINHYSDVRIKLTQIIKNNGNILPFTVLSDTFLVNKRFINAGGSIDYAADRFECIMIEV